MELEETINWVERLEKPKVKLLILGKGRSERRLEFTFHQLGKSPDFYSFDFDGVYEVNFVQKFQSLNHMALIQANGNIEFFGSLSELDLFLNSEVKN
ncbi:hypothetical protein [Roseivirga sp.]|uniref:hypothetical protein n=1 Tax=Roseivirga sp. TaxID=1964215 RepID=UPI003B52D103